MTGTGPGLAAVESLFGAGTTVAPMDGARLVRFVGRLQDPWSGGLHLALPPPTAEDLRRWIRTWRSFEQPGRLRWAMPVGEAHDDLADAVGQDLVLARRAVLAGRVDAPPEVPEGVTLQAVQGDPRAWAGFEVLARWADLDEDPGIWRWRARRVRHLVEGGRGVAVLARTASAPVGAVVRLDPPEHFPIPSPCGVSVVVHQAHRGRGIAAALLAAVAQGRGEVAVLGDPDGRLPGPARRLGLTHVEDLVEVGHRADANDRKA